MKNILVVEDNEKNMYLISFIIEKMGHRVIQAHTGEDGVELAVRERPDLILMDIQLPGIDGLETTKRIREAGIGSIPVIAITLGWRASRPAAGDPRRLGRDRTDLLVRISGRRHRQYECGVVARRAVVVHDVARGVGGRGSGRADPVSAVPGREQPLRSFLRVIRGHQRGPGPLLRAGAGPQLLRGTVGRRGALADGRRPGVLSRRRDAG